jgi:hypothetical protein
MPWERWLQQVRIVRNPTSNAEECDGVPQLDERLALFAGA